MELYKSDYFSIDWIQDKGYFHYVFNKNTARMTSEEYVDELKIFIDFVKTYKPKKVLGDMLEFDFAITPEVQKWIDENLFTVYKEIGFEKIAILLSQEFIASLSIEQTMEEATVDTFESRYFDNEKAALDWLMA